MVTQRKKCYPACSGHLRWPWYPHKNSCDHFVFLLLALLLLRIMFWFQGISIEWQPDHMHSISLQCPGRIFLYLQVSHQASCHTHTVNLSLVSDALRCVRFKSKQGPSGGQIADDVRLKCLWVEKSQNIIYWIFFICSNLRHMWVWERKGEGSWPHVLFMRGSLCPLPLCCYFDVVRHKTLSWNKVLLCLKQNPTKHCAFLWTCLNSV